MPNGSIGRISSAGAVTNFAGLGPLTYPQGIVAGPDKALWFTSAGLRAGSIGRITTAGKLTHYTSSAINFNPATDIPAGMTVGPDGALWFSDLAGVGRITTAGKIVNYPTDEIPWAITNGPNGTLWFATSACGHPLAVPVESQAKPS